MRVLILCQIHAPPRRRVGNTITPTAQGPAGLRSEAANPPFKRNFRTRQNRSALPMPPIRLGFKPPSCRVRPDRSRQWAKWTHIFAARESKQDRRSDGPAGKKKGQRTEYYIKY